MKIACSRGEIDVQPGDRFDLDGCEFVVVGPGRGSIYSPSGFGGTPIVDVKLVSGTYRTGFPTKNRVHAIGEVIAFCGDSVAAFVDVARAIARGEQPYGGRNEQ